MIIAAVIAISVLTFPYQDVGVAVQHPSPASFLRVGMDVATSIVPFYPQARIAVALIPLLEVMAKHPAMLPMKQAQTHESRGGRRC